MDDRTSSPPTERSITVIWAIPAVTGPTRVLVLAVQRPCSSDQNGTFICFWGRQGSKTTHNSLARDRCVTFGVNNTITNWRLVDSGRHLRAFVESRVSTGSQLRTRSDDDKQARPSYKGPS
ncbi:unnamed protein product [Pylaiella littoralis]